MPLEELIYHRHKKYAQDNRENIGIIPNCLNLDAKEINPSTPLIPLYNKITAKNAPRYPLDFNRVAAL